jgi:hypothetical protein
LRKLRGIGLMKELGKHGTCTRMEKKNREESTQIYYLHTNKAHKQISKE